MSFPGRGEGRRRREACWGGRHAWPGRERNKIWEKRRGEEEKEEKEERKEEEESEEGGNHLIP